MCIRDSVKTLPTSTGPLGGLGGVAFSPDGTLAIGNGDGTVRLWNPATGRPAGKTIQTGSVFGVPAVAFSPDSYHDHALSRPWGVDLLVCSREV